MFEWTKSVPNNGLLRYYVIGNMERVLVASPKALSELLVQNAYDFQKPELVRRGLGRVTGKSGILLVEGAEHKVGFCVLMDFAKCCRGIERISCPRFHTVISRTSILFSGPRAWKWLSVLRKTFRPEVAGIMW